MALNALLPRLTVYEGFDNPVGLDPGGVTDALGVVNVLLLPILFVGIGAVVARFRRATGEERLQLKWLALAMGLVAAMFGVYGALVLIQGTAAPTGSGMLGKVLEYLTILSFLGVPVSVGFGILKYRLYDIDLVINKTVVFGVVATGLTLVAVLVLLALPVGVLGTGLTGWERGLFLVGVAIGTPFGPLRRIARRWADRLVYGKRATPYEVLTAFGERVGETYATEDVLPRLAQLLANGTGASSARVLLRIGPELREVARWPADADISGETEHTTPVTDQGEELGALGLAMPPNDPMDPSKERLVRDLASQVGLLLRNVRLVEELRASGSGWSRRRTMSDDASSATSTTVSSSSSSRSRYAFSSSSSRSRSPRPRRRRRPGSAPTRPRRSRICGTSREGSSRRSWRTRGSQPRSKRRSARRPSRSSWRRTASTDIRGSWSPPCTSARSRR